MMTSLQMVTPPTTSGYASLEAHAARAEKVISGHRGWLFATRCQKPSENKDKYYIVGRDHQGYYARWGRWGSRGTRKEHPSLASVLRKLHEKMNGGRDIYDWVDYSMGIYPTDQQLTGLGGAVTDWVYQNEIVVDLSSLATTFDLVRSVRWDESAGRFLGLNGKGETVLRVPTSFEEKVRDLAMNTGSRAPSRPVR